MDEEISSDESIDCEDVQIELSLHQNNQQDPAYVQSKDSSKSKPKQAVNVRASKGRVLRYLRLPKAVDFMSPDTTEYFSDAQRSNLFAQLRANRD